MGAAESAVVVPPVWRVTMPLFVASVCQTAWAWSVATTAVAAVVVFAQVP
jgi:hypothetical protein